MANIGHFTDRNKDIRAAGVTSSGIVGDDIVRAKDCLNISSSEEMAEYLVRAKCLRNVPSSSGTYPRIPSDSVGELITTELRKSRFISFKDKFYEDLYTKKSNVGEIRPANSKPDSVTNLSQTFGTASVSMGSLYSIVMPEKSVDDVNREYSKAHEKYIISHNHYLPSEQVNRKYTKPFDRLNIFGEYKQAVDSGLNVKRCLVQGDNHLMVIGKAQEDFRDRTLAPLGKKFSKYPCSVPDIVYGAPRRSNGGVKMMLENGAPRETSNHLMDAIFYLKQLRLSLKKRNDFQILSLLLVMKRMDNDQTGHLRLEQILKILGNFHGKLDTKKIRLALSHFRMIIDENCITERVKYEDFCKLLSIHEPLPNVATTATLLDNDHCKDTTYRLLCADLQKKPHCDRVGRAISDQEFDEDNTRMKDLLSPDLSTLHGVGPSDFNRLRSKSDIQQIFKSLVSEEQFEEMWQRLMAKYNNQDQFASVNQFREEMHARDEKEILAISVMY
ncbi:hypothetical protein KR009_006426 [Drosophila setifemur]|nr:hypothetical protein KR009_006426 [Drosophila setifemur]